jgi:hypothetical protein
VKPSPSLQLELQRNYSLVVVLMVMALALPALCAAVTTVSFRYIAPAASSLWLAVLVSALLLDLLLVQPAKALMAGVVVGARLDREMCRLVGQLSLRCKLIFLRQRGVVWNYKALVQHLNPACRAARAFPASPVAKLLISINDDDVCPREGVLWFDAPLSCLADAVCWVVLSPPAFLRSGITDLAVAVLVAAAVCALAYLSATMGWVYALAAVLLLLGGVIACDFAAARLNTVLSPSDAASSKIQGKLMFHDIDADPLDASFTADPAPSSPVLLGPAIEHTNANAKDKASAKDKAKARIRGSSGNSETKLDTYHDNNEVDALQKGSDDENDTSYDGNVEEEVDNVSLDDGDDSGVDLFSFASSQMQELAIGTPSPMRRSGDGIDFGGGWRTPAASLASNRTLLLQNKQSKLITHPPATMAASPSTVQRLQYRVNSADSNHSRDSNSSVNSNESNNSQPHDRLASRFGSSKGVADSRLRRQRVRQSKIFRTSFVALDEKEFGSGLTSELGSQGDDDHGGDGDGAEKHADAEADISANEYEIDSRGGGGGERDGDRNADRGGDREGDGDADADADAEMEKCRISGDECEGEGEVAGKGGGDGVDAIDFEGEINTKASAKARSSFKEAGPPQATITSTPESAPQTTPSGWTVDQTAANKPFLSALTNTLNTNTVNTTTLNTSKSIDVVDLDEYEYRGAMSYLGSSAALILDPREHRTLSIANTKRASPMATLPSSLPSTLSSALPAILPALSAARASDSEATLAVSMGLGLSAEAMSAGGKNGTSLVAGGDKNDTSLGADGSGKHDGSPGVDSSGKHGPGTFSRGDVSWRQEWY